MYSSKKQSIENQLYPIIKKIKKKNQTQWETDKYLQNTFRGCDATGIDHTKTTAGWDLRLDTGGAERIGEDGSANVAT